MGTTGWPAVLGGGEFGGAAEFGGGVVGAGSGGHELAQRGDEVVASTLAEPAGEGGLQI